MTHRAHLDYASNAPLRTEVREAMSAYLAQDNDLTSDFWDPRRLYDPAIETRYLIEENRAKVADFVGCSASEVIFTSSASESLATFAYGSLSEEQLLQDEFGINKSNVIITPYDSKVIKETYLRENINIRVLPANADATLDLEKLEDFIDENTRAFTIPYAHPDTGTIQDIRRAVEIVKAKNPQCLVHLDARIALGNADINFDDLGIDAMTIDPAVFGGPFGIAALILKSGLMLRPLLPGSTQERARRAGIENILGIIGFGTACETTKQNLANEMKTNEAYKSEVVTHLKSRGAKIIADDSPALPYIVCAYFEGVAASVIVQQYNSSGVNIHAGSSCGSEEFEPSNELVSVVGDENIAESAFRLSWGFYDYPDLSEILR